MASIPSELLVQSRYQIEWIDRHVSCNLVLDDMRQACEDVIAERWQVAPAAQARVTSAEWCKRLAIDNAASMFAMKNIGKNPHTSYNQRMPDPLMQLVWGYMLQ